MNLNVSKRVSALFIGLMITASSAWADFNSNGATFGDAAANVTRSTNTVSNSVESWCYLFAFIAIMGAGFALMKYKENKRDHPLWHVGVLVIVAVMFAFAPSVVNMGGATVFGAGAQSVQKQAF